MTTRVARLGRRSVRRLRLVSVLAAVGVVVLGLLVPLSVGFADDELLELGRLDPELSPPAPQADCGSARRALDATSRVGTGSFYELARARACEDAARRRVLASVAGGAVLGMAGLVVVRLVPGADHR